MDFSYAASDIFSPPIYSGGSIKTVFLNPNYQSKRLPFLLLFISPCFGLE